MADALTLSSSRREIAVRGTAPNAVLRSAVTLGADAAGPGLRLVEDLLRAELLLQPLEQLVTGELGDPRGLVGRKLAQLEGDVERRAGQRPQRALDELAV